MKKIAVIGANEPLEQFYIQAKELGYYIVGIAWEDGTICKKYCDKFYPISFTDKDAVLKVCQDEQIDGITSFSLESALPTVIYVAEKMGLVSNSSECIERTKTKFAQRRAFEQYGIPVPKYQRLTKANDIDLSKFRFPIIVKPIDGGGSRGITMIENPEVFDKALKDALENSRSREAIVEEFISGREFSVEYISHKGQHYPLQITDKVTSGAPHFIEIQHHQPANIDESTVCRICNMVEKALDALKIENSPSHTEIKLNNQGELYIIEIGARLGGDNIRQDQ